MPRQRDNTLLAAVGTRIRDLRTARGVKQEKLAELAGIEPRTLSGMENGRQGASLAVLASVAAALNVPLAKLLDIEQPERPAEGPSRREWDDLWERMTDRQRGAALRVAREIAAL